MAVVALPFHATHRGAVRPTVIRSEAEFCALNGGGHLFQTQNSTFQTQQIDRVRSLTDRLHPFVSELQ